MPYWQRTLLTTAVFLIAIATSQYFLHDGLIDWKTVGIGALIYALLVGGFNYYNRTKQ